MKSTPQIFASITFFSIAIFLLIYTWVPAKESLQSHEATINAIVPGANTWYEIHIVTSEGTLLQCKTRRGWPLIGPSRCPLEKIEPLIGQKVTILDNGKQIFDMKFGNDTIIDYTSHQKSKYIGIFLSLLMLTMTTFIWRKKSKN